MLLDMYFIKTLKIKCSIAGFFTSTHQSWRGKEAKTDFFSVPNQLRNINDVETPGYEVGPAVMLPSGRDSEIRAMVIAYYFALKFYKRQTDIQYFLCDNITWFLILSIYAASYI